LNIARRKEKMKGTGMTLRRMQFISMLAVAGTLFLAGCSTKSRQIETTGPRPGNQVPPADDPQWRPSDGDDGYATVVTEIPQEVLTKYLDPNARLEYKFSYLTAEKSGNITFADNKARIEITELPINQTGTMKMEMFENGTLKLEGTKESVTLKSGPNSLSMSLRQVGGDNNNGGNNNGGNNNGGNNNGGSTTADLVLSLEIIPEGSTDPGTTPPTGGGINFQNDILPLARSYCLDCHARLGLAAPDNEAYFKGRGNGLISRLNKSASNTMPQRGSQEAQRMSDDDRAKMIEYIKSL
jgi:hypothetical protein